MRGAGGDHADLCFDWFEGRWIPLPIDSERFPYEWRDGRVVGHSPSRPERKGTSEFMEATSTLWWRKSTSFRTSLTTNAGAQAPLQPVLRSGRVRAAALGGRPAGIYANAALEAAVRGIPTIAHLSEESFEGALRGGRDLRADCLIINTPLGVEGIRATLRRWLDAPAEEREHHSRRTRAWVERVHSYRAVAAELAAVYDAI